MYDQDESPLHPVLSGPGRRAIVPGGAGPEGESRSLVGYDGEAGGSRERSVRRKMAVAERRRWMRTNRQRRGEEKDKDEGRKKKKTNIQRREN